MKPFKRVKKTGEASLISASNGKRRNPAAQEERQLFESLRFFIIISQIFVCAPYGFQVSNVNSTHFERFLLVLHPIWCIAVSGALLVCIVIEYNFNIIVLPIVQRPLYFFEYLLYVVHTLHIIAGAYYSHSKYKDFLLSVVNIDQRLKAFKLTPKYTLIRNFLHRHLLLNLLFVISTAIVDYYAYKGVLVNFVRSTVVYTVPNSILHIALAQYYGLLYTTAVHFVNINYVLQLELKKNTLEPRLLHSNLCKLRSIYADLEIFVKRVNTAFQQTTVMIFLGSLTNVSINIFFIYKYMSYAPIPWPDVFYSGIWCVMYTARLVLVLYYNDCVQSQKCVTAHLLNDVKGSNAEMEETISHFILQLLLDTRSNVACGVTALNMDLVTTFLVVTGNLFIFLLQYDITFEALSQTHSSASIDRKSHST